MASNDGWEEVPVDSAHGWEDMPMGPPTKAEIGRGGDLGAMGTGLLHTARHLSFGLGDKIVAGLASVDEVGHKNHFGNVTGGPLEMAQAIGSATKHALTPGDHSVADAYGRNLKFLDKSAEVSDEAHPVARWVGNAAGVAGSLAVPGAALRALRGAPAAAAAAQAAPGLLARMGSGLKAGSALGAVGGFGNSRDETALGTAEDAAIGAGLGGALGGAAPAVGAVAGKGARLLGKKAQDAAAWLKVNSLHPTPTLGEAMEALPGGRAGVGRELLERKIGGLTKHATAGQIERELGKTGSAISETVNAYDARGGARIGVAAPIEKALERAEEMNAEPTTRSAAERLADTVNEYRGMYSEPVDARTALAFKRTLGDAAYKAGDQLQRSGDHVAGDYGRGLGGLERGVNAELEAAVGPEFTQANLAYRRLLGAGQAADRVASRGHANHPIGLIPMVAGAGGAAHGAKEGMGAAAAAMLFQKYGAQAGAKALWESGRGLNALGASRLASPGITEPVRESVDPKLRAIIEALRGRVSAPVPSQTFAMRESE